MSDNIVLQAIEKKTTLVTVAVMANATEALSAILMGDLVL